MKKYLIRRIGWVYNDLTYDNDGERELEGIYTNKQDAIYQKEKLERIYFIKNVDWFNSYDLPKETKEEKDERIYRFCEFLVNELNVNPTVYFSAPHYGFDLELLHEKPTVKQLDKLINILGVYFFKIIEIDTSEVVFYKSKLNKEYWNFSENYQLDLDYDKIKYFNTRKDAYLFFYNHKYDFKERVRILNNSKKLSGSFDKLTEFPNILLALVQKSPYLKKKQNSIEIDDSISFEDFLKLDSLLKKSFILLEAEKQVPDFLEGNTLKESPIELSREWNNIASRFQYDNDEEYYLSHFSCQIRLNIELYRVLISYLLKYFKYDDIFKHGELQYRREWGPISGVIAEMKIENDTYHVKSCFSRVLSPKKRIYKWELDKKGLGSGKTVNEAFKKSFEDWLNKFGIVLVKQLNNN